MGLNLPVYHIHRHGILQIYVGINSDHCSWEKRILSLVLMETEDPVHTDFKLGPISLVPTQNSNAVL